MVLRVDSSLMMSWKPTGALEGKIERLRFGCVPQHCCKLPLHPSSIIGCFFFSFIASTHNSPFLCFHLPLLILLLLRIIACSFPLLPSLPGFFHGRKKFCLESLLYFLEENRRPRGKQYVSEWEYLTNPAFDWKTSLQFNLLKLPLTANMFE